MSQQRVSASSGIISLPVVKYSWSVGQNEVGASQWTHLCRDDIYLVFDDSSLSTSITLSTELQSMKVIQGSEVVELVPLERLIQRSQKARDDASQQMVQILTEQLPIHALYRRSTYNIAFKYRNEDGQLRRNQFKFGSVSDFDTVMEYLKRTGCPIMDSVRKRDSDSRVSESRQSALPHADMSRPSTSSSLLGQQPQSTIPQFQSESRNHEFRSQAQAHLHASAFPASHFDMSLVNSSLRPMSRTSSPIKSVDYSHGSSRTIASPSQDFAYVTNISKESSDMPPPRLSKSAGRIETPTVNATPQMQEQENASKYFQTEEQQSRRPATAPLEHYLDYLNKSIPPRRELPFKSSLNGPNTSSSGKGPGSRSSSAAVELPPLPTPKILPDGKQSSSPCVKSRNRAGRRSKGIQPVRDVPNIGDNIIQSTYQADSNPATSSTHVSDTAYTPTLSSNRAPLQESTSNEMRRNERQVLSDISKTNQGPVHAEALTAEDKDSLARYASQSEEDRMEALESMICDLINDDDFLKLSEDAESCWRRIGLTR